MTNKKMLLALWALFSALVAHAQSKVAPKREFRAVWIASVANIDWPSAKGLPVEKQQQELRQILDHHQQTGINAAIVQVRPATDAFYFSPKEPWSEWLTGKQGAMPEPFYDPLQFMVDETHQRGMEFHAWLNPYRAVFDSTSSISPDHITQRKPEWFVKYGKSKVFNPGLPEVRNYIIDVVSDIVRRYDVDAIHFDDYFYPYQIKDVKFGDDSTFAKLGAGYANIEDWRRNNVNVLIEGLSQNIRKIKPHVKFGISPFGVWRNKSQDPLGSLTQGGQTCYDHLYADIRLWLMRGWIDYVAPQVYFSSTFDKVPYKILAEWWTQHNFGKHLYIGQAPYRIGQNPDPQWGKLSEMPDQLRFNRQFANIHGSIYFSSKSLTRNLGGFRDSLRQDFYRHPALVPTMPWKGGTAPAAPQGLEAFAAKKGVLLTWQAPPKSPGTGEAAYYAVYRFAENTPIDLNNPANIVGICRSGTLFTDTRVPVSGRYRYVVTALDRLHNEGRPTAPASLYYDLPGTWADFTKVLFSNYLNLSKKKEKKNGQKP